MKVLRYATIVCLLAILGAAGEVAGTADSSSLCPPADLPKEWLSLPYPASFEERWPGGWTAYYKRVSENTALWNAVFSGSLVRYVEAYGRPPATLKDLCESGATALRCADLINPFTGKPFSEGKPGEIRALYLEPVPPSKEKPASVLLVESFLDPITGKETVQRHEWREDSTWIQMRVVSRVAPLPPVDKAALAVKAVRETLDHVFVGMPCARAAGSWEALVSRLPFLTKLRNEYTGGYARMVFETRFASPGSDEEGNLLLSLRGSPGDFAIIWHDEPAWPRALVFGADGKDPTIRSEIQTFLLNRARSR